MGRWGHGILEGDKPWDIASALLDALGVRDDEDEHLHPDPRYWSETQRVHIKTAFEDPSQAFKDLVNGATDCEVFDVCAALMLGAGAAIKPETKDVFLCVIDEELPHVTEFPNRIQALNELRQLLNVYDETPTFTSSQSLFGAVAEAMGDAMTKQG